MSAKDNPAAEAAPSPCAGCAVPPASADPAAVASAAVAPPPTRRGFLKSSGMLSVSSLMGAGALMAPAGDAKAAVEWAEHFQKNYRLMTDQEK